MKYDGDIFDAVEWGDLETTKTFWTDEIDVDWQDLIGMNLLMYAVKNGHKEIVNYLLQFNPNLYLLNKENETVFQLAENIGNNEIYQLLLSKCLNEDEKVFLIEWHVKPKLNLEEIKGAYVNSWIVAKEIKEAKRRAKLAIEENNWEILNIEEFNEVKKEDFNENDTELQYFEQSIIDKEVLVFYTYDDE